MEGGRKTIWWSFYNADVTISLSRITNYITAPVSRLVTIKKDDSSYSVPLGWTCSQGFHFCWDHTSVFRFQNPTRDGLQYFSWHSYLDSRKKKANSLSEGKLRLKSGRGGEAQAEVRTLWGWWGQGRCPRKGGASGGAAVSGVIGSFVRDGWGDRWAIGGQAQVLQKCKSL